MAWVRRNWSELFDTSSTRNFLRFLTILQAANRNLKSCINLPLQVGQFKIHPDIPETLTEVAKTFIENCFTPDPDKRATAEDLLADIFLDT